MQDKDALIVIDAGNTRLKIGVFVKGQLVDTFRTVPADLSALVSVHPYWKDLPTAVSSVRSKEEHNIIITSFPQCQILSNNWELPFTSAYKTPETIGMDRLCNVAAALSRAPQRNCVIIDIGTCLKFDYITSKGVYQGGSISPGLHMRFAALHEHTGRLPLIQANSAFESLVGQSTEESILSGVQRGMAKEIEGFIEDYKKQYSDLTLFVTGGDAAYFDFDGKNGIFVDENLTLKGIYAIYSFHAH
jgi:type III pantothenate kinase